MYIVTTPVYCTEKGIKNHINQSINQYIGFAYFLTHITDRPKVPIVYVYTVPTSPTVLTYFHSHFKTSVRTCPHVGHAHIMVSQFLCCTSLQQRKKRHRLQICIMRITGSVDIKHLVRITRSQICIVRITGSVDIKH